MVLEDFVDFASGQNVREEGYPSHLSECDVVQNGLNLMDRPYRLFSDNCEHLVAQCHGLPKHSPQLKNWTIAALAGLFVWSQLRGA